MGWLSWTKNGAMSANELAFEQALEVLSLSNVLPGMATIFDLLGVFTLVLLCCWTPDDVDEAVGISL